MRAVKKEILWQSKKMLASAGPEIHQPDQHVFSASHVDKKR